MKTKSASWVGAAALALASCLAGVTSAHATMLVDRGLPTTNLNNIAGPNRSNVAWVFGGWSSANYWMVGDTFTNTGSQTWAIDTIRLWSVGATGTAALWGGIDGSTIGLVPGSGALSNATYADGSSYQGSNSTYSMHQIDFAVSILLAPGQTYDFFLDGTGNGNYGIPFVHASNAPLSGSPQDGANGLMLYANILGGTFDPSSVGTWDSSGPGGGWDKSSDVNVQVFGMTAVPEPPTLVLFGLGLAGLAFSRRRKQV